MPGTEQQATKKQYIFSSESAYEKERLKRLNEVYNPRTKEILKPLLRPHMRILEIGPGNGELGAWMIQTAGEDTTYTAVDAKQEALDETVSRIPNAEVFTASVTEIDQVQALEGRKFDLIYFRWVLAYTPSEKFQETLGKLYGFLGERGLLVCEECNVYKVACASRGTGYSRISYLAVDKWLQLSHEVDAKFNANFQLGKKLKKLLVDVTQDEKKVEIRKYQPLLQDEYSKSILFFGMKSARTALVQAQIRQESELDALTQELEALAANPDLGVYYVKNTVGLVRR